MNKMLNWEGIALIFKLSTYSFVGKVYEYVDP